MTQHRFHALDGARGLAALMVLGSHLSNAGMHILPISLSGIGKYGVYLFFSLSAFLLTDQILRLDRGALLSIDTWRRYALRRVLRIYPLFAFVVVLSYLTTPAGAPIYAMSGESAMQHLLLQKGDSVLWSIPVEMTYYLVLPFVGLALHMTRSIIVGSWIILASILAAMLIWPASSWPENSTNLGYYLPVFLMGSLAAYLNLRWQAVASLGRSVWAPVALVVLAIPSLFSTLAFKVHPTEFHDHFLLFALIWGIFLLAVVNGDSAVTRFLRSWPMRFVGSISFSLYLLHAPVISAISAMPPMAPNIQAVAVIVASMATAYLVFRAVEVPAMRIVK